MNDLRWILLGVGVLAVVGIYFYSRSKSSSVREDYTPQVDDIPSVSIEDDDADVWKDGVGPVRVVKREPVEDHVIGELAAEEVEQPVTAMASDEEPQPAIAEVEAEPLPPETDTPDPAPGSANPEPALPEVIALYVVARDRGELKGEQILSATYALNLEHGDMNIFHRKNAAGTIEFSMANMLPPGDFDLDGMHEMTTRGVSLFFQPPLVDNPARVLDEMMLCSHSLSTMLNGDIITEEKIRLDEAGARRLRTSVKPIHS